MVGRPFLPSRVVPFLAMRPPVRATVGLRSSDRVTPMAGSPESDLRTRIVGPADAGILGGLLPQIDPTYFRPHEMTAEGAARIAAHDGRDLYVLGFAGGEAVAYGMLRGWDEGYVVPSLGIGVRSDMVRRGYGRAMMLALHDAARTRGAARVRLRVHPANVAAVSLYRSLGYRVAGAERGETVMLLDLGRPGSHPGRPGRARSTARRRA